MNRKICVGIVLVISLLLLAGCKSPMCYPPNKIIDNKCCLDANDDDVCDYDEEIAEKEAEEAEEVEEEEEAGEIEMEEQEPEEEIEAEEEEEEQEVEPALLPTGLEPGKYEIRLGEQKQYLQINKLTAYRTSRDKGIMDYMVFTVRNIGDKKLNPVVELFFEGARVDEHEARVKKEYVLEPLEPGEKLIVNKALGIRYEGINKTKKIKMYIYEQFVAPRENLATVTKEFVPQDLFESMEIYTYGLPDY
jgi:hypothetical protein